MKRRHFLKTGIIMGGLTGLLRAGLARGLGLDASVSDPDNAPPFKKITKTDAEWKRILTPDQYEVTRRKGTEAPYSSPYNDLHARGIFLCVSCELPLFSSDAKFDSHTGWPSFWRPIARENVREAVDHSLSETRTEVLCNRCDAHLGHVFDDGPPPTGLRYCMNGVALKFVRK